MRTTNPVFNQDIEAQVLDGEPMTVSGTINKTFVLLFCALIPACVAWYQALLGYTDKVNLIMWIGLIVGAICAFIVVFKQKTAPYLAPIYAFAEGAFLGGLSGFAEKMYPGIAIQAVGGTFLVLFVMLGLYKTKLIRTTQKFRSVIFSATLAIAIIYFGVFIGHFFGIQVPFLFSPGPIGIGFSIVVIVIASLSLIIDFDRIEDASMSMVPKYYEWYLSFGLMLTLVWLYIEILRLIALLRSDN